MTNVKRRLNPIFAKGSGFSLIELMIAMLIGLIILNGVIQVVISSKRTYLDNQAISQIQENARFALDTLSREVRVAGYVGCMPVADGVLEVATSLENTLPGFLLNATNDFPALQAFDNVNASNTGLPNQIQGDVIEGTDVLIVRHTDTNREWIVNEDLVLGANLTVGDDGGMPNQGQPMALVSHDCAMANLFLADGVSAGGGGYTVAANDPTGNLGASNFRKGSRLTPIVTIAYYIGTSSVIEDMPALMREVIVMNGANVTSRSEELAIGVDDMQVELGDVGAVGVSFQDASAAIDAPVAVRLELSLRSHQRINNEVAANEQGEDGDDGFIRKVATTTVRVRNQG